MRSFFFRAGRRSERVSGSSSIRTLVTVSSSSSRRAAPSFHPPSIAGSLGATGIRTFGLGDGLPFSLSSPTPISVGTSGRPCCAWRLAMSIMLPGVGGIDGVGAMRLPSVSGRSLVIVSGPSSSSSSSRSISSGTSSAGFQLLMPRRHTNVPGLRRPSASAARSSSSRSRRCTPSSSVHRHCSDELNGPSSPPSAGFSNSFVGLWPRRNLAHYARAHFVASSRRW